MFFGVLWIGMLWIGMMGVGGFPASTMMARADQTQSDAGGSRPNVVVFLCDDLGYGDLGCYGHPHIRTPNLDRLAAGGWRMTQFYSAAPVCSPSRVGLLTGRSPNRAGVYDWIPPSKTDMAQSSPANRHRVHMRDDEVTIADVLSDAGYQTAMVGKWHCNSQFNADAQPQPGDHGFDYWTATQNNASPSHQSPDNFVRNGKPIGKVDAFSCQFVVDEAISWLGDIDASRPFFLYLPFHEPHEPVASPEKLVESYRSVAENEDQAHYYANVSNVDDAVGRLLRHLDQTGLRDDTLVVFTSDNGPETLLRYKRANRSYGTPGELRGMKLHTTDAGFRVAGIFSWPGRLNPATIDQPVSSLDLLPTFARLAGGELPDRRLDGMAVPMDATKVADMDRQHPLVWTYFNALNGRQVAMRMGDYKVLGLIRGVGKMPNLTADMKAKVASAQLGEFEIYDVVRDIDESENLFGRSDRSDELVDRLRREYRSLLDDSPVW